MPSPLTVRPPPTSTRSGQAAALLRCSNHSSPSTTASKSTRHSMVALAFQSHSTESFCTRQTAINRDTTTCHSLSSALAPETDRSREPFLASPSLSTTSSFSTADHPRPLRTRQATAESVSGAGQYCSYTNTSASTIDVLASSMITETSLASGASTVSCHMFAPLLFAAVVSVLSIL